MDKDTKKKLNDGNWLAENEKALKSLFPLTFTHIFNLDENKIMNELKNLGLKFSNKEELTEIIRTLKFHRIIVWDNMTIKRNHRDCVFD